MPSLFFYELRQMQSKLQEALSTTRIQLLLRLPPAVGLFLFMANAQQQLLAHPTPPLAVQAIAETVTMLIYLTARTSKDASFAPIALLSTLLATFYFLFIDLKPGPVLAPMIIVTMLQSAGIGLQLWAKVTLGRSFGLLPANKGIVVGGPYGWVRHPIYLGYFITHVGFLLGSWSPTNALLFSVLYAFQFIRISREEALLMRDPAYRDYSKTTRFRFLPGLF